MQPEKQTVKHTDGQTDRHIDRLHFHPSPGHCEDSICKQQRLGKFGLLAACYPYVFLHVNWKPWPPLLLFLLLLATGGYR